MSRDEWDLLVNKLRDLLPEVLDKLQSLYDCPFGDRIFVGDTFVGRGAILLIYGGDERILQAQLACLDTGRLVGISPTSDDPMFLDRNATIEQAARWVIDQLCVGMEDGVAVEWMALLNLEEPAKT